MVRSCKLTGVTIGLILCLIFLVSQVNATSMGDRNVPEQGLIAPIGPIEITINPASPTTDDVVSITVNGVASQTCGVAEYQSHQIIANVITIDAVDPIPEPGCGDIATPWSFTIGAGHLPAGSYDVQVSVPGGTGNGSFSIQPLGVPPW